MTVSLLPPAIPKTNHSSLFTGNQIEQDKGRKHMTCPDLCKASVENHTKLTISKHESDNACALIYFNVKATLR